MGPPQGGPFLFPPPRMHRGQSRRDRATKSITRPVCAGDPIPAAGAVLAPFRGQVTAGRPAAARPAGPKKNPSMRPLGNSGQRGISLVEIALTLVIVALVMAGILAGRELITQSQAKAVASDFNSLIAAYVSYQDRYNAIPGDDPRADVRWKNQGARRGTGDGLISGTYEAAPPAPSALQTFTIDATQGESLNYWWHLRLAEFLPRAPGAASTAAQPLNAFAGIVGVQMNGAGLAGFTVCQANLPGRIAGAVDAQLDDLRPATGQMRGLRQTVTPQPLATASPVTSYSEGDGSIYVLCRTP